MKKVHQLGFIVVCMVFCTVAHAQETLTDHTYKLSEGAEPGMGALSDVSWLVGSWQGTAFGSQFEEVWNPASAGSMVGMFKLFDEEKGVNFYELMLLREQQGSLELLVKHFSADFIAWEDKADFITFKLVRIEEKAVHFSGLSFYQKSPDKIEGYIVMKHKDGSRTEHLISYKRTMD
ncbi:DUF6265 family protein [Marinicella litoralis]|uniref:DUF6265 domain-containing protein n=1 Tax=Marinicella litoralis TaxID=644220 RepID=A0A4R6XLF2_9GAMM|nr:DUF6265 family protein [Marinicella litoralis]TDR20442.1 hypothetical protein C8D91_1414 [Marinicella litoralis]